MSLVITNPGGPTPVYTFSGGATIYYPQLDTGTYNIVLSGAGTNVNFTRLDAGTVVTATGSIAYDTAAGAETISYTNALVTMSSTIDFGTGDVSAVKAFNTGDGSKITTTAINGIGNVYVGENSRLTLTNLGSAAGNTGTIYVGYGPDGVIRSNSVLNISGVVTGTWIINVYGNNCVCNLATATGTAVTVNVGDGSAIKPYQSMVTANASGAATSQNIFIKAGAIGSFAVGTNTVNDLGIETASIIAGSTSAPLTLGLVSVGANNSGTITTTTGALTLTSNNSIITVTGTPTISGITTITNTTTSTSAGTGALVLSGAGAGLGVNSAIFAGTNITAGTALISPIHAGQTANGGTLSLRASTNDTTGTVAIVTTTASTGSGNGALTVAGGLGVTGAIFGGSTVNAGTAALSSASLSAAAAFAITAGTTGSSALTLSGGATNTGSVAISNTTPSVSTVTGSFTVAGGVGVAGATWLGGIATITSATASSGTGTGALVLSGASAGLGVAGAINAGGTITAPIVVGSTSVSGGGSVLNASSVTGTSAFSITAGGTAQNLTLSGTTTGLVVLGSGTNTSVQLGVQMDTNGKTITNSTVNGGVTVSANGAGAVTLTAGTSTQSTAVGTGTVLITGANSGLSVSGNVWSGGSVNAITVLGSTSVSGGGSVLNASALTGASALTVAAGGANQNLTLAGSGTGLVVLGSGTNASVQLGKTLNANSNLITGVADAVSAQDAVSKRFLGYGNVIRVDAASGNATGSQGSYSTFEAAIAAATAAPTLVLIFPGTYNVAAATALTLSNGVSVVGLDKINCVVNMSNTTAVAYTAITLGSACLLQNFTLNVSQTGAAALTAVSLGSNAGTTQIDTMIINSTRTNATAGTNIAVTAGGGVAAGNFFTIQNTSITVSNPTADTGIHTGVLISTATTTLRILNSNISVTGAGGTNYGASTATGASTSLYIIGGYINGGTADIINLANAGTLSVSGTTLANSTAGGFGITELLGTSTRLFQFRGQFSSGTYYLYEGSETVTSGSTPFMCAVPKTCLIPGLIISASSWGTSGGVNSIVVTCSISAALNSDTATATLTAPTITQGTSLTASTVANTSVTVASNNYFAIKVVVTNLSNVTNLRVIVPIY